MVVAGNCFAQIQAGLLNARSSGWSPREAHCVDVKETAKINRGEANGHSQRQEQCSTDKSQERLELFEIELARVLLRIAGRLAGSCWKVLIMMRTGIVTACFDPDGSIYTETPCVPELGEEIEQNQRLGNGL